MPKVLNFIILLYVITNHKGVEDGALNCLYGTIDLSNFELITIVRWNAKGYLWFKVYDALLQIFVATLHIILF